MLQHTGEALEVHLFVFDILSNTEMVKSFLGSYMLLHFNSHEEIMLYCISHQQVEVLIFDACKVHGI